MSNGAAPSPPQRRNFSVTKTVAEATGFVLNNIRLLARIGAVPFAVETAGLLRALWAERAHESYLSEMWAILYLIAIVPYQTQIQRYVLGLVPISERPALFPWDMRETRFLLHAVGLFLVAAVLSFCSLIPFAIYGWLYSGSLSFHITGLAAVPGVLALAASLVYAGYIFARLQIVLPATAIGTTARWSVAWRLSRGNSGKMLLTYVVLFIYWILMLIACSATTAFFPLDSVGEIIAAGLCVSIVTLIFIALCAASTAIMFRVLSETEI